MFGQGIENILDTHFLPQFLQHESAHSPAHTMGLASLTYRKHHATVVGSTKNLVVHL